MLPIIIIILIILSVIYVIYKSKSETFNLEDSNISPLNLSSDVNPPPIEIHKLHNIQLISKLRLAQRKFNET